MTNLSLRTAQDCLDTGDIATAYTVTHSLLKQNPRYADAWVLMATIVTDKALCKQCLKRALVIDPNHHKALVLINEPHLQTTTTAIIEEETSAPTPTRYDWSKLSKKKRRTQQMQNAQRHPLIQFIDFMGFRSKRFIGAMIILCAFLTYRGVDAYLNPPDAIQPAADIVLLRYWDAYFNGDFDTARQLVCSRLRQDLETDIEQYRAGIASEQFSEAGFFADHRTDFSTVQTDVQFRNTRLAWVYLTGDYHINNLSNHISTTYDIQSIYTRATVIDGRLRMQLVVEDQQWRVC